MSKATRMAARSRKLRNDRTVRAIRWQHVMQTLRASVERARAAQEADKRSATDG